MSIFASEQEKNAFFLWYDRFRRIGLEELSTLNQQQYDFVLGVRSVIHWTWLERPYKDRVKMDALLQSMQNSPDWLKALEAQYATTRENG